MYLKASFPHARGGNLKFESINLWIPARKHTGITSVKFHSDKQKEIALTNTRIIRTAMNKKSLLAVDAGLRTGFALYQGDGRLCWYRSQHFGTMEKLRRVAYSLMNRIEDLGWVVVEGGGDIANLWIKNARKRKIRVKQVRAEVWRQRLLYLRERRTSVHARKYADGMARQIIRWSGIHRPTSLRHDTAEAILIGMWGVLEFGLVEKLPEELHRR